MERTQTKLRRIYRNSPEFPERLKHCSDMPETLYVIGSLPDDARPSAAIVGARMCSTYGRIQAFRYAKLLSAAGVQVISGMAAGIDSEGHKGALEGRTPTFAVLGNGADICYPSSNRSLYRRIPGEGGGILSEYEPGTEPRPWNFPARNRIISAFSDLVLVVEAKEKSGSLITAQWALEQGKSVFALPGPVNEALSRGCHKLIYDGAGIAFTPEIILEELGINYENKVKSEEKTKLGLATEVDLVYSCLDLRPKSRDFLAEKTGLSPEQTGSALMELTLTGLAREIGRQYYVKVQT